MSASPALARDIAEVLRRTADHVEKNPLDVQSWAFGLSRIVNERFFQSITLSVEMPAAPISEKDYRPTSSAEIAAALKVRE